MLKLITPNTQQSFNTHKDLSEYLTQSLCSECWKDLINDIPTEVFVEMSYEEWIDEMLLTMCGAEWFVEYEEN